MRIGPSVVRCALLLLLASLGALQSACVGGHIPPSTFQFTNVVPYKGPGGGGWKVAQVVVLLARISPVFPETATCEIEVGVPELNRNGLVSDEFAQEMAAKAADDAAHIVLREHQPTALVCDQFRKHTQAILSDPALGFIPGAKVNGFTITGMPRKSFP